MSRLLLLLRRVQGAIRLLLNILAEPSRAPQQPGSEAFPKRIFELDPGAATVPGGRTAAYAALSRDLRLQSWASDTGVLPPLEQWFRRIHGEVLRAHELELRLLAHLESMP